MYQIQVLTTNAIDYASAQVTALTQCFAVPGQ